MTTAERRGWEAPHANWQIVDTAAAWLRHRAVQEHYAGGREPDRALMAPLLLDSLSLRWDRIPPGSARRGGSDRQMAGGQPRTRSSDSTGSIADPALAGG